MKPILFNTEMVCATLDGRKTATRRVIKDPYYIDDEKFCRASGLAIHKGTTVTGGMPYPDDLYSPGDILYVRETWATTPNGQDYLYKADSDSAGAFVRDRSGKLYSPRWHPSIHMPKEAARVFLRVVDVRVERLQEITIEQVLKEGITRETIEARISPGSSAPHWVFHEAAKRCFAQLWDSTVAPEKRDTYGWAANPWVWVIEFERCEKPKEGRP